MAFDKGQFRDLIRQILKGIDSHTEAAMMLLLGTAAHESHFGTYLKQTNGPALGVFQMEPDTEEDIWVNFLTRRQALRAMLINATGQIGPNVRALESNIAYQIAMARCHYLRFPEQLPDPSNIEALGRYWKKYWNTDQGKGTIGKFVGDYNRFVGPGFAGAKGKSNG